jgi:hypothetical protein
LVSDCKFNSQQNQEATRMMFNIRIQSIQGGIIMYSRETNELQAQMVI